MFYEGDLSFPDFPLELNAKGIYHNYAIKCSLFDVSREGELVCFDISVNSFFYLLHCTHF